MPPGPDRADRNADDGGDLFVGEILHEVERRDHPIFVGQPSQSCGDLLTVEPAEDLACRIGAAMEAKLGRFLEQVELRHVADLSRLPFAFVTPMPAITA